MTAADPRPTVVLLVEDELLVRLLAQEVLEDAGFRVLEARDGQEALAILEMRPDVRLLFTDVNMPSLDGISLARIVANRFPAIRIIVTSALAPESELPTGARFLPKPYLPETIIELVEEVLGEGHSILPELQSSVVAQREMPSGPGGLAQPLAEPDE